MKNEGLISAPKHQRSNRNPMKQTSFMLFFPPVVHVAPKMFCCNCIIFLFGFSLKICVKAELIPPLDKQNQRTVVEFKGHLCSQYHLLTATLLKKKRAQDFQMQPYFNSTAISIYGFQVTQLLLDKGLQLCASKWQSYAKPEQKLLQLLEHYQNEKVFTYNIIKKRHSPLG